MMKFAIKLIDSFDFTFDSRHLKILPQFHKNGIMIFVWDILNFFIDSPIVTTTLNFIL